MAQWTRLKIEVRFRGEGLDLPEKRKGYTSSRGEEEDAQTCSFGKGKESGTDVVAKCEPYENERDVLESGMREVNVGGLRYFDALVNRKKAMATLGGR